MASLLEPEVQFAQRLASNEKPIRTKAVKKLRKYINVRSQKATGGFTGDELLKLWKGLFYCVWMQDKPQLQEELSKQISTLIHSFHSIDGQFLYLESFLLTFKREWTGIDRLRMDKFFQMVRFMFRQTFEMLKRRNWESSVIGRFLELLTAQLLQSSSAAPSGLQLHILDLYMTELAAVGSAELTADQNLIFMEPFCKTAAKTKDRTLFGAICSSIFSTIIDQAPFAIEDLMREVKTAEDMESDSGQASEEDDEDQLKEKTSRLLGKRGTARQINGFNSNEDEEDEDDDLSHFENSDCEPQCDDDVGPVLQFDYAALADKLFELASRSSTPSHNRQKLYKIIKVLRDLSEGTFPQYEYPEEVSTDEDDDMFGSRKRMKREGAHMEEDDEGDPAAKKRKGKKKEASKVSKENKKLQNDDCDQSDLITKDKNLKKQRRKKNKKAGQGQTTGGEDNVERCEIVTQTGVASSQPQSLFSSVEVTDTAASQSQSKPVPLHEVKKQPSSVVSKCCTTDIKDQTNTLSKKNKEDISESKPEVTKTGAEQQTLTTTGDLVPGRKKKNKGKSLKDELQTDPTTDIPVSCETSHKVTTTTTPARKNKKSPKAEREPEDTKCELQANGWSSEDVLSAHCQESDYVKTPAKKKRNKKSLSADETHEVVVEKKPADAEIICGQKMKRNAKRIEKVETDLRPEAAAGKNSATPLKKKKKQNHTESRMRVEEKEAAMENSQEEDGEKLLFEITMTTPAKKKQKVAKLAAVQISEIRDQTQLELDANPLLDESDLVWSSRKATKKKRKIPVVFEFEADEKEAELGNGAAEGSVSDFITFQSNAAVPTPLFCKTKRCPCTPLSSKKVKKNLTANSESKKVTFGLKNNKTAEFKKTDRSLLVSPDGTSRVPFDPKQKPKFGVLKSPPTPLSKRKRRSKSTPRKWASAADL